LLAHAVILNHQETLHNCTEVQVITVPEAGLPGITQSHVQGPETCSSVPFSSI